MKLSQSRRGFLAVVIAGACLLPINSYAANIIVGTGNDTSYLVLQSSNLGVRTYEVRYTYNAGNPQYASLLLDQVLADDSSVTASILNFGTPTVPSLFVNSFTFNSVTETSVSSSPFVPFWAHWVSGGSGFQGPPPDFNFDPGTPTLGNWTLGYGISTHTLAPGSWDALYFSDGATMPSVVPIPEPSVAVTALLGSFALFARRRRTS